MKSCKGEENGIHLSNIVHYFNHSLTIYSVRIMKNGVRQKLYLQKRFESVRRAVDCVIDDRDLLCDCSSRSLLVGIGDVVIDLMKEGWMIKEHTASTFSHLWVVSRLFLVEFLVHGISTAITMVFGIPISDLTALCSFQLNSNSYWNFNMRSLPNSSQFQ